MSGGGRRGEVRARNARPEPKDEGGTHNRKARRAARARGRLPDVAKDPVDEAAIAARVHVRFERQRADREAYWRAVSDDDVFAMVLEQSGHHGAGLGGPWFRPLLLDAVPRWAQRHADTAPDARVARAHELGEVIAYSQGAAALADPDAVGTEQPGALAEVFNAIAEGLAIGAFCPGGATLCGINWECVGRTLRESTLERCTIYPLDDHVFWSDRAHTNRDICQADH